MNYSIIRFILTVALCFSCNLSQAITKNIKEYHLNGNVYCIRVKEYSFKLEFGEINRGNQISEYSTYFLKNGNVYIDSLIPQKTRKRYFYDKYNNLTEEMRINSGAGRKVEIGYGDFHYNDTINHVLYKNTYNNNGHIKEICKYENDDNNFVQTQRIEYSKTNNEEKIVYWTKHGLSKVEINDANTRTIGHYSSFNDYKSPIISTKEYLNKNCLPIKMLVESVGRVYQVIYTYDEHNNLINETVKDDFATKIITRQYSYDKNGNWVRLLEFEDGQLKIWKERDIFYAKSDSDYDKVVNDDKKAVETFLRISQKETRVKDSIDNVAKEEAARKKQYEDSIKAVVAKLDVIIEKEMLQKHLMGVPQSPFDRYNINMKLRDTDGVIKSFNIMGSTIHFTIKKVKTPITVDLLESRIRKYYWAWNEFSEGKDEFQVGFTSDFNDIVIARPFLLLLHKEDNEYKAYTPDPKITNLSAINNSLKLVQKEDLLFLREYFQLFWNPNKGSVADQYKESTSEVGNETSQSADNHSSVFDVLYKSHSDSNSKVYGAVDEMPQFPGGPSALIEYLSRAVRYPAAAEANGIQGRVMCSFVVEPNGSISNVKVIKGVDPSLDKEAIRVISSMPKWIPGMLNGTPVRVNYSAPVTFRLQ